MKYLLLFEKFKSMGLSKTIEFIKSKSKKGQKKFLSDLKGLLVIYDFPISEFTDDDVHYMSAKKAKLIKTDNADDIMNPFGVYAIKFWFSLNEYIGYTGVGAIKDSNINFNQKEMDKIKELGYETGTLTYLYDTSELKTGDKVAGYFARSEDMGYFTMATIYRQHDTYYAIQDVNSGSSPSGDEWRQYGRYSWSIGSTYDMAGDNYKLHVWRPGDNELKNSNQLLEGDSYVKSNGVLSKKIRYNDSIENLDKIEEADFSLVIYLDPLIKHESVKDTRKFREESKKGATALMSDEQIKKLNYEKYITSLISKSGINIGTTTADIKDLQNIILKILVGRWALITVYKETPGYKDNINNFFSRLKSLINSNEEEKQYYMDRFLEKYESIIKESKRYESQFKGSMKKVENNGNENTKKMVNEVIDMSIYFQNKLKNYKIDTIEDAVIISYKLKAFQDYMNNSDIDFEGSLNTIIRNFNYNDSDVDAGIRNLNNEEEERNDETLKKLELIKRFIDTTF
jgi:hypothetical protein